MYTHKKHETMRIAMNMMESNEARLWKNQGSSINGIPNIVLPNTLLNYITWDIQWSDVIHRRV